MSDFYHNIGQSYEPLRRILSSDRINELEKKPLYWIQFKNNEKHYPNFNNDNKHNRF